MKLATYRTHSLILNVPHFAVQLTSCRHERHPPAGSLLFWKSLPRDPSTAREALVPYRIHPECALLEYHHNTLNAKCDSPATPDTPSPQVGSSKVPCYACKTFFSAYQSLYTQREPHHELSHYPVHLRLSSASSGHTERHGLWLPPVLDGVGEDVEAGVASRLLKEYRQYTSESHSSPGYAVT